MSQAVLPEAGSATRYGVVGVGRVGAAVCARLLDADRTLAAVSAHSDASLRRARAFAPGAEALEPAALVESCDVVLIAVPDDVLPGLAADLAPAARSGQVVAHTSGRHGLAALEPFRSAGARPIALHPAMTFTGAEAHGGDVGGERRFAVGVTAAPDDLDVAADLARVFGGVPVTIEESDRVRYHAALSHGSNHLVTLVAQARRILDAAGAGDEAELILRPLLEASLDNALRRGDEALTGPISRGDAATVAAHLEALDEPDPRDSYAALARATVTRALDDERLDTDSAHRLLDVIGASR